uniref:Uncharacterized protein n=1 Tax=Parascaris equorum TaxID=6256 RepID=A0A914SEK9_PAREQ
MHSIEFDGLLIRVSISSLQTYAPPPRIRSAVFM